MKILLALLLALNAPMIRADEGSGDEIEELRLQRERSEKADAYLKANQAAIQQFTGKDTQGVVDAPAIQNAIEAGFDQREQEIEKESEH